MLAAVAAFGTAMVFLGHGVLAAQQTPALIELFAVSMFHVTGASLDWAMAANWVRWIGYLDILVALALIGVGFGYLSPSSRAQSLMMSRVVIVLFAWGVIWQFLTTISPIIAAGAFKSMTVWTAVERAPSFMLALVGLMTALQLRGGKK